MGGMVRRPAAIAQIATKWISPRPNDGTFPGTHISQDRLGLNTSGETAMELCCLIRQCELQTQIAPSAGQLNDPRMGEHGHRQ